MISNRNWASRSGATTIRVIFIPITWVVYNYMIFQISFVLACFFSYFISFQILHDMLRYFCNYNSRKDYDEKRRWWQHIVYFTSLGAVRRQPHHVCSGSLIFIFVSKYFFSIYLIITIRFFRLRMFIHIC